MDSYCLIHFCKSFWRWLLYEFIFFTLKPIQVDSGRVSICSGSKFSGINECLNNSNDIDASFLLVNAIIEQVGEVIDDRMTGRCFDTIS